MRDKLQHVLSFIEENLARPLCAELLAAEACLSVSHFQRVFKKEVGTTPKRFIDELRLAKAYELLTQGEGAVQDLAISLGYNDYETFSRAFKRRYHFSPDDLKAIAQKTKEAIEGESQLFVITSEDYNIETIRQRMIERLQEADIDINEIEHSKALMIQPIDLAPTLASDSELIKNKYVVSSGVPIWEKLVEGLLKNKEE